MRHRSSRIKSGPRSRPVPYGKDGPEPYPNNETEDQYYRCRKCGFICSTNRDAQDGYGDGCTVENPERRLIDDNGSYLVDELGNYLTSTTFAGFYLATVNSGCPLCGTFRWKD